MGWHSLLFDPSGPFLCMCIWGGFPDLRTGRCGRLISLLRQSSAPAIHVVLGVSRENRASLYSAPQAPPAQPRGPSTSYLKMASFYNWTEQTTQAAIHWPMVNPRYCFLKIVMFLFLKLTAGHKLQSSHLMAALFILLSETPWKNPSFLLKNWRGMYWFGCLLLISSTFHGVRGILLTVLRSSMALECAACVFIPALPATSRVSLGKLLNLSISQVSSSVERG